MERDGNYTEKLPPPAGKYQRIEILPVAQCASAPGRTPSSGPHMAKVKRNSQRCRTILCVVTFQAQRHPPESTLPIADAVESTPYPPSALQGLLTSGQVTEREAPGRTLRQQHVGVEGKCPSFLVFMVGCIQRPPTFSSVPGAPQ